jgi:hypothetical protein
MSLDRKAYRVRTSSALVRRACTLAPKPDFYPLAIGYWSLRKKRFTTETQRTLSLGGIRAFGKENYESIGPALLFGEATPTHLLT